MMGKQAKVYLTKLWYTVYTNNNGASNVEQKICLQKHLTPLQNLSFTFIRATTQLSLFCEDYNRSASHDDTNYEIYSGTLLAGAALYRYPFGNDNLSTLMLLPG
jgi:hypothetical protein